MCTAHLRCFKDKEKTQARQLAESEDQIQLRHPKDGERMCASCQQTETVDQAQLCCLKDRERWPSKGAGQDKCPACTSLQPHTSFNCDYMKLQVHLIQLGEVGKSLHWPVTLWKLHFGQIGTNSAHQNSLQRLAFNFTLNEILVIILGILNRLSLQ